MKPIYFPDTFIPKPILHALFSCFEQVTVYQPAQKLVPESLLRMEREGRLEIRLLEEEAGDDLPDLLKAYHSWADLHRGERLDFHKFSPLQTRGPDDVSTAWIRSKIRSAEKNEQTGMLPEKDKTATLLLRARLFLAISQEYDANQESLSEDLHDISAMEQKLLHNLVPDPAEPSPIEPPHPLLQMLEADPPLPDERLNAWYRLHAHYRLQRANEQASSLSAPPPFFITSNQAVLELLTAPSDTPETVCRILNLPTTGEDKPFVKGGIHEKIYNMLGKAADNHPFSSAPDIYFSEKGTPGETTGTLTLYRMKGDCITANFSKLENIPELRKPAPADIEKHDTLVGLILLNQFA